MKKMFRNASVMMLAILLLLAFSFPEIAMAKQTTIVATVLGENAGCGNHAGSFYAMYKGKRIDVEFSFSRLKTELELCAPYGQLLAIAGKSVTIIGEWGGVSQGWRCFRAEEVYLTGTARKAEAPGDVEYILTVKKINKGKTLRVYLNGKEIQFRQREEEHYYNVNIYPLKQGNEIADRSGVEGRVDNLDPKGWNGKELVMVAKKTGIGTLDLLYRDKKFKLSTYHISFRIVGR
jgi:hypothetical protein